MLVFDHGWHQLAVAVWLFGPIRRIFGWIGETELAPGFALDAPATLVWEHHDGLRGVLDLTLAPDTFFRSDYYTCDERVEVTGQRGSVRCNRISSSGRQEPSVEVYREGEVRSSTTRSRTAATPGSSRRRSTSSTCSAAGGRPDGDGRRGRAPGHHRVARRARVVRRGAPSTSGRTASATS